ncbi:MAG: hypothetical protein O3A63_09910 [Proteobacteria bacterium]|nr:hypothetical protein [Pseudomonadota bacterium]
MKALDVPVIDIARLDSQTTLAELDRACREWGFFQIVNHGIDQQVLNALTSSMDRFFSQTTANKRKILRTEKNPWGFYDQELTKNILDWKEIYDYGPADGADLKPQWPSGDEGFRHAMIDYYAACETLAFRLLGALSTNLGVDQSVLGDGFRPQHSSFVRLNYYPVCPEPVRPEGLDLPSKGHLGINHHTDAGALTILLQDDQPGLEVLKEGIWYLVEPMQGALVINIGDIVQVWSNDRYKAALHRVIASKDERRFSAPFFFNPSYATDYAPLRSVVSDATPARYRPINWGEFRAGRAAGDYADYGTEIQISHYQVG